MSDQENYFNIDYPGYSPLEVTLKDPEDFLKVRETLSRIGVASKKEQVLYQSCHILHKKGRYFITHFKELFALHAEVVQNHTWLLLQYPMLLGSMLRVFDVLLPSLRKQC